MSDEFTEDEEEVLETAVWTSVGISFVLDFFAGTLFGVIAIMSGLEDWLIRLVEKLF